MNESSPSASPTPHRVSVVIPVYQGERTLGRVVEELVEYSVTSASPQGRRFEVTEIIPVYDHGPDGSARVIRELAERHAIVRPVWLSRNFGQHPATMAGMASSSGDWIVTMDEDGQQDPAFIGRLLDAAVEDRAGVVYGAPTNPPPHGAFRNAASRASKRITSMLMGSDQASKYNSYRFLLGEVGRSVAAYAGPGVYLDVALGWIANKTSTAPVVARQEGDDRRSGYRLRTLLSHFWRMVVTSGTRVLRLVSLLGALIALIGVVLAVWIAVAHLVGAGTNIQGWSSLMVVILLSSGAILFALGVLAEYIGVAVNSALGRPLYVISSDPLAGPLYRDSVAQAPRSPTQ
ncbi:glycosyltransferase [Microbacterium sp. ASV81]|uniref:Glycosyltransferase n=1 Tax=Microbacterium capsulatum TaxID=3041921 RepID=A0ABU0XJT5_9MICO|nr:glycosyltransferase [Microbacterium sp. ASV81]MDQ4215382.1 glycosyltransferase [Microbacterium sp. ASV81]